MQWTKPNGGDAIDRYLLNWSQSSISNATVAHKPGKVSYEYQIFGLEQGQYYDVTIAAENSEGISVSSSKLTNTCNYCVFAFVQ